VSASSHADGPPPTCPSVAKTLCIVEQRFLGVKEIFTTDSSRRKPWFHPASVVAVEISYGFDEEPRRRFAQDVLRMSDAAGPSKPW